MNDITFFERWAQKPDNERDRMFYLLALPIVVTLVSLAPHAIQAPFHPGDPKALTRLAVQVIVGSAMIGFLCHTITRWLSRPKKWGPQRHKWPSFRHLLLIWIPAALIVDAPLRFTELAMFDSGAQKQYMNHYFLGLSLGRTFLYAGGVVFYEKLLGAVMEAADQRQRALRLETQTLKKPYPTPFHAQQPQRHKG